MSKFKFVELRTLISPAKVKLCGEHNYPVLSMTMHNGLVFQNDKFKKEIASKDKSTYKVVYHNQLVISFPIDEGVLATQRITDAGIVSPAYSIWDVDMTRVIPEFLEYALRCDRALSYYKAKLRGSTARRRSLPTPTLLAFTVPLPSIEEQQHILNAIEKSETLIAHSDLCLSKLDELVKSRFIEMFGEPISNPKGWEVKPLGELGNLKNGMNYRQSDNGYSVRSLGVGDFGNLYDIHGTGAFTEISLTTKPTSDYLLQNNDIVFVRSNGNKALVGRSVEVFPDEEELTFSGFCIRFRNETSDLVTTYLNHVLHLPVMRNELLKDGRGANIQNVNQQMLSALRIPLPPLELQTHFADFVRQADKSKLVIKQSLEQLETLKKSLMQKYFG